MSLTKLSPVPHVSLSLPRSLQYYLQKESALIQNRPLGHPYLAGQIYNFVTPDRPAIKLPALLIVVIVFDAATETFVEFDRSTDFANTCVEDLPSSTMLSGNSSQEQRRLVMCVVQISSHMLRRDNWQATALRPCRAFNSTTTAQPTSATLF